MQNLRLKVTAEDQGLRLDQYIIKHLGLPISRSRIQRLIKEKKISANQKPVKAHYKVKTYDILSVNIPDAPKPKVLPEKIPLDIIFEDQDILIINKPDGLVTHPAASCNAHTLVNALLNYGCSLSTVNGPKRPGIVHRLDKDTSGAMVIAKNDFAHLKLAEQFRAHTVKRKYIAIVSGKLDHNEGLIDYPLARDPKNRQRMTVIFLKNSKPALTRFRVLKRYKEASLLELTPHTGRTHQLRVHLKFCGHPILGDRRYGKGGRFQRLFLHAQALGFRHPRTDKFVEFSSELPECFKDFLEELKS